MKLDATKLKKKIITNIPYVLVGAIATNIGEAIRSIALSILVANIDKKLQQIFFALFYLFLKKLKPNGWLAVIGC